MMLSVGYNKLPKWLKGSSEIKDLQIKYKICYINYNKSLAIIAKSSNKICSISKKIKYITKKPKK